MSIFKIKQSFILYKHLAIFTRLCLFVNTCCMYSTQLRGSFCSRMLRQISHLLNEDISWLVSSICEKYIMGKYFWSQLPMWIVRNFHNNLKIAIDKSITLVKMKDKFHTKSPWMTNGLFKSISKKDQLYKNF
jgi:hypothetical protein